MPQFQGYADHLETAEFRTALEELDRLRTAAPTAVMCAEALPWRCHRSILSDAEVARGVPVFHILGYGSLKPHALPDFARVNASADPPRITHPKAKERQVRLSL